MRVRPGAVALCPRVQAKRQLAIYVEWCVGAQSEMCEDGSVCAVRRCAEGNCGNEWFLDWALAGAIVLRLKLRQGTDCSAQCFLRRFRVGVRACG